MPTKRKLEATKSDATKSEDTKLEDTKLEEIQICNICFDELGTNNFSITKCGHSFCNDCFLESLSLKKECPCCRSDIFDITKNKKKICFNKATSLANNNLSYVIKPNFIKLIEDSLLNIFKDFKCSCSSEICPNNNIIFEECEIKNILDNIKKITEKTAFKHYLTCFVRNLSFQTSMRQIMITKHFYEN